jgi:DNA (cytosine-5)-methyltransferase 1
MTDMSAIVLFSGAGGTTQGLLDTGLFNTIASVELDQHAADTARAAGHNVIQADLTSLDPWEIYRGLRRPMDEIFLQASPPCQGFSKAGKGEGRGDIGFLFQALDALRGFDEDQAEFVIPTLYGQLIEQCVHEGSPLLFDVIRWIAEVKPDYIMLEQVPTVLPVWERIAELLEEWGYGVWTGKVYAEQYGVPQTRTRAILMAAGEYAVGPPTPTHSKYHNRTPTKLDEGVPPWVSMAEALGWGERDLVGFPRKNDGRDDPIILDGQEYRSRDLREAQFPAFVVTEKGRSWMRFTHMGDVYNSKGCIRGVDQPAPTMTASMDNGNFRWHNRVNNQSGTEFDYEGQASQPASVVAGREVVTFRGANANRFNGRTKSRNDGFKVTVQEAGVLQSFPWEYPWQGTKTQQYQQVGNAVPPLLQKMLTQDLVNQVRAQKERAA